MRPVRLLFSVAALVLASACTSGSVTPAAPEAPITASIHGASSRTVPFEVTSVSFVDPDVGWALGNQDGLQLRRTRDGGLTWTLMPSPPARFYWEPKNPGPTPVVSAVRFVDARHGYLYGTDLLATSDGGASWQVVPQVRHVSSFAFAAGHAAALTQVIGHGRIPIRTAAVGSSTWVSRVTPAHGYATLLAAGKSLVLLQTGSQAGKGRLWTSPDLGVHWSARTLPCTNGSNWAAALGVAYGQPRTWYVDCNNDEESSQHLQTEHRLWRSVDAGRHWTRLGEPTKQGLPGTLAASGQHVLLTDVSGAADVLSSSSDGGLHWRDTLSDGGSFYGWDGPTFVSPTTAYAVGPTHNAPEHLYRTDDGGSHWRRLAVG